jgi:hypothetical protein
MSMITTRIFCKPRVRAWLLRQYDEPVNLPRRSNFRHAFLNCLQKDFYPSSVFDRAKFSAHVDFALHKDEVQQHGHTLNPNLQYHLNNVIEEQLRNELFIFIYASHINGSTIDDAVHTYQMLMNFTEDQFSLDAIRRAYFRRKKEYENIFRSSVTQINQHASAIA